MSRNVLSLAMASLLALSGCSTGSYVTAHDLPEGLYPITNPSGKVVSLGIQLTDHVMAVPKDIEHLKETGASCVRQECDVRFIESKGKVASKLAARRLAEALPVDVYVVHYNGSMAKYPGVMKTIPTLSYPQVKVCIPGPILAGAVYTKESADIGLLALSAYHGLGYLTGMEEWFSVNSFKHILEDWALIKASESGEEASEAREPSEATDSHPGQPT